MPVTVKRVLNLCLSLTIAALVITSAQADIIYESGTLQGFLGGSCPGCEYDNWISHISEGIASPGYNHYGPRELDPQTTGFGRYQLIEASPAGDSLIAVWYSLFANLFAGDTATIASYMNDTGLDSIYQLVILTDVDRQYYILREIFGGDVDAFYLVSETQDAGMRPRGGFGEVGQVHPLVAADMCHKTLDTYGFQTFVKLDMIGQGKLLKLLG